MLKLIGSSMSSNTQKVQCFLEEINLTHELKYEFKDLELHKGEHRKAEFLSKHPLGAVPVIELDGFTMAESNSILRYLAQKFGRLSYYPINLEDNALVNQMMDFFSIHVSRWISVINWQRVVAPILGQKPDLALTQQAEANLLTALPRLERYLSKTSKYICGPEPTIADISFTPLAAQYKDLHLHLRDFPLTDRYVQQLIGRPAWQKVVAKRKNG